MQSQSLIYGSIELFTSLYIFVRPLSRRQIQFQQFVPDYSLLLGMLRQLVEQPSQRHRGGITSSYNKELGVSHEVGIILRMLLVFVLLDKPG